MARATGLHVRVHHSRFTIHDLVYFGSPSRSSKFGSCAGVVWLTDARVAVNPIIRPATITPTQITREIAATVRAIGGVERRRSQSPRVRRAVSSNTIAFRAASASISTFARNHVLWK